MTAHLTMQPTNTAPFATPLRSLTPRTDANSINRQFIDAELVMDAFRFLEEFGYETTFSLCQDKLFCQSAGDFANALSRMNIDASSENVLWLSDLDAKNAQKIIEIINAVFHTNVKEIITSITAKDVKEIPVLTNNIYEVVAQEGRIYFKQYAQQNVQLMEIGPFLRNCDPSVTNRLKFSAWEPFLHRANLSEVNLDKAKLRECSIASINFTNSSLRDATLKRVYSITYGWDAPDPILEGTDLSNATIKYSNLICPNMKRLNLTGASLFDVKLHGNLENANLTGAVLEKVNIFGCTFHKAIFDNVTTFTLAGLRKSKLHRSEVLDELLNHLNNPETGSLLTTIDSIDDKYEALKLDLMHQVIAALDGIDTTSVNDALMDIWINKPFYLKDPIISRFIKEKILSSIVTAANTKRLTCENKTLLPLLLLLVSEQQDKKKFMLENNGFFVQLLALGIAQPDPEVKAQAVQLYYDYMNLDELQAYKEETGIADGNEISEINEDDLAFVFFNKDEQDNTNALIVSQQMINGMLKPDPDHDWSEVFFIRNEERTEITDLGKVYSQFALFNSAYQYGLQRSTFPKLLTAIDLCFTNPGTDELKGVANKDYTDLFTNALNLKYSEKKLIGDPDQVRLMEIFSPLLQKEHGITDVHYQQICDIYHLSGQSETAQAQMLFCLAAVFATYSSSYIFGKEGQSPNGIRGYVMGLITKAHALDTNVFIDNNGVDQYGDWMARLLRKEGKFDCTAVLKGIMIDHATEKGFGHIMAQIKPPAW